MDLSSMMSFASLPTTTSINPSRPGHSSDSSFPPGHARTVIQKGDPKLQRAIQKELGKALPTPLPPPVPLLPPPTLSCSPNHHSLHHGASFLPPSTLSYRGLRPSDRTACRPCSLSSPSSSSSFDFSPSLPPSLQSLLAVSHPRIQTYDPYSSLCLPKDLSPLHIPSSVAEASGHLEDRRPYLRVETGEIQAASERIVRTRSKAGGSGAREGWREGRGEIGTGRGEIREGGYRREES